MNKIWAIKEQFNKRWSTVSSSLLQKGQGILETGNWEFNLAEVGRSSLMIFHSQQLMPVVYICIPKMIPGEELRVTMRKRNGIISKISTFSGKNPWLGGRPKKSFGVKVGEILSFMISITTWGVNNSQRRVWFQEFEFSRIRELTKFRPIEEGRERGLGLNHPMREFKDHSRLEC